MRANTGPLRSALARAVFSALALCGQLTNGWAQPASESEPPALAEVVDVRVVNVDVVVLDKRGRPVSGLQAGDFRLTEDGRPVEVQYFTAAGGAAPDSAAGLLPAAQSSTSTGALPRVGSSATDSSATDSSATLAVLLDERLLQPAGRRSFVEGLDSFLGSAGGSFERVVFGRYRDELELVAGASSTEVAAALAEEGSLALAVARGRDLERALDAMVTSHESCEVLQAQHDRCEPCWDNWQEQIQHARQFAMTEELRVALAIDALAELVSWLAGIDGEKLLVYPSDGLPHRPGIEAFAFLADICSALRSDAERETMAEMMQLDVSRRIRDLGAWANARGVRMYPLDSGGLRVATAGTVQFARPDLRPSSRFDDIRKTNAESGLYLLADETGGKATFNTNRPLADLDLRSELQGRYVLGFVPAHPPTGRRHELRVELTAGRGRDVRYRRSYFDRTLDQRMADQLQSALRLGYAPNDLGAVVTFGEIGTGPEEADSFLVPVRIEVGADRLTKVAAMPAVEGVAAESGRLRLWLGALRDDGAQTEIRQEQLVLGTEGLQSVDGRYHITVTVPLAAGRWTVAVGLRDELAQQTSLLRGVVEVGGER